VPGVADDVEVREHVPAGIDDRPGAGRGRASDLDLEPDRGLDAALGRSIGELLGSGDGGQGTRRHRQREGSESSVHHGTEDYVAIPGIQPSVRSGTGGSTDGLADGARASKVAKTMGNQTVVEA